MNIVNIILQGILAMLFLVAGFMKLTTPHAILMGEMAWVEDFSSIQIKLIAALEATCRLYTAAWSFCERIETAGTPGSFWSCAYYDRSHDHPYPERGIFYPKPGFTRPGIVC